MGLFQSPLHRDVRFNVLNYPNRHAAINNFSPLFIGMYVSTSEFVTAVTLSSSISVPSSSGCTFQPFNFHPPNAKM